MTDSCCCPPEAGNAACELPAQSFQRPSRPTNICPVCGERGKPVQGQTVKALLSVSLREVQGVEYLFCKTQTCPVVYFSPDSEQTFSVEQVRERVYQKEPDNNDVFACYCFRHTVGEIHTASSESRKAILEDINTGINAGQCACDLRNPQGSCCLGNVRGLIKRVDAPAAEMAKWVSDAVWCHRLLIKWADVPYLTNIEGIKLAALAFEKDVAMLGYCVG